MRAGDTEPPRGLRRDAPGAAEAGEARRGWGVRGASAPGQVWKMSLSQKHGRPNQPMCLSCCVESPQTPNPGTPSGGVPPFVTALYAAFGFTAPAGTILPWGPVSPESEVLLPESVSWNQGDGGRVWGTRVSGVGTVRGTRVSGPRPGDESAGWPPQATPAPASHARPGGLCPPAPPLGVGGGLGRPRSPAGVTHDSGLGTSEGKARVMDLLHSVTPWRSRQQPLLHPMPPCPRLPTRPRPREPDLQEGPLRQRLAPASPPRSAAPRSPPRRLSPSFPFSSPPLSDPCLVSAPAPSPSAPLPSLPSLLLPPFLPLPPPPSSPSSCSLSVSPSHTHCTEDQQWISAPGPPLSRSC